MDAVVADNGSDMAFICGDPSQPIAGISLPGDFECSHHLPSNVRTHHRWNCDLLGNALVH